MKYNGLIQNFHIYIYNNDEEHGTKMLFCGHMAIVKLQRTPIRNHEISKSRGEFVLIV